MQGKKTEIWCEGEPAMDMKEVTVVFYRREFKDDKWRNAVDEQGLDALFERLGKDLASVGVRLLRAEDPDMVMEIKGYGDLLNSVRIRSPKDGVGNMCLGHVIGQSAHLNLVEDIERGVNRAAFAPETIEPEGSDKVVCHNCGCGC